MKPLFRELVDSCHARGIRVILDGVFNHTGVDFFAFAGPEEERGEIAICGMVQRPQLSRWGP